MGLNTKFQVADHDFTRFSLVPSVTMICDIIPESIQKSFYRCVYVCMYSSMCTLCVCAQILLESLFVRLELKEKPFQVFHSSSSPELDEFWNMILQVDSTLTKSDTRAPILKQKHGLRSSTVAYRGTTD